jgi:hypothetical protein
MAMSESGDLLLRLFEQPVKESKFKAREQAQESARQLIRAQEILEEAGHKNTEFMFERDSDGKITGNFMRDRNYRQFYADKAAYQDELDEEYGPMSPGKKDMMKKWLDARADHNGTQ